MNILVLGGAGFIGTHVVNGLLSAGHHVRVLNRAPHHLSIAGIESVEADISDVTALSEALTEIDTVIHLISTSLPSTSNRDPVSDVNDNLINTIKLLELMRQTHVSRIIFFSSGGTVYGHPISLPMTETHPTNPICSYGIVKLAIEKYLQMYRELYGFTATILRPSNPYGPGQRHTGVQGFIGTCINSAFNNTKLTIWGDGSVIRDYIYISDVVDATLAAVRLQMPGIYNISSGVGHTLNEIIDIVEKKTDKKITAEYKSGRNFDIKEMVLANSKACEAFSWRPTVDIETGVSVTINAIVNDGANKT